jgi:MFS family permease
MTGIILMTVVLVAVFLLSAGALTIQLVRLPVLGSLLVISLFLMVAGAAWALININSLPMVVDMTDAAHLGTYTGLYYMFSTLAAIAGPWVNGGIIDLAGNNYNLTMMLAPVFFVMALILVSGVRRGEAATAPSAA